ncbi:MAG: PIN domain-containing protein [Bacteroidota bacterium]|jgi:hypothetical protein
MRIVLDTNILCADYPLKGNAFRIFLQALSRIGAKLYIPQIVIDEVLHKYETDLQEIAADFSKTANLWRRHTGDSLDILLTDKSIKLKCEDYSKWLLSQLHSVGTTIIPYPIVTHDVLARRAIERRRPFQESGKGYRDALIWESIRTLFSDKMEAIYFITNNSKDFGLGPEPHADLSADLQKDNFALELFQIVPQLEKFNNQFVTPQLERLDGLIMRFSNDNVSGFSLSHWIVWELKDLIRDEDYVSMLVGLESGHASTRLSSIQEIKSINVDDVRLLPNGDILLSASSSIKGEVAVNSDDEAYFRYDDVRQFWGEPPGGDATAWIPIVATIFFSIILKKDTFEFVSAEIDEINGDFGEYQINPHPKSSK